MDLVFKRYSGPYFLDLVIENSNFDNFIDMLLKKQDEEKLWEMYLATAIINEKSFEEWKKEILGTKNKTNYKAMTKKEYEKTIQKSEEILRGFKPPQKGGKL
ncbi:MAG: hypothetical protein HFJ48_03730 [Clostridia bacterium]|nr:hypothetical protein [Clostridia bacterium]